MSASTTTVPTHTKPSARRLYAVEWPEGVTHLVDAISEAQAIRHVVKDKVKAHLPTTREVAELVASGVKVEKAGD
jgi:hypothetical protein